MPFSVSCLTAGVASRREHRAVGVVHRVQKRLGAHARVSFDRTRRNHIAPWFESTVTALEKCLDSIVLLLSANTFARQDTRDRDECGTIVGERALDSLSDVNITDCVVSGAIAGNTSEQSNKQKKRCVNTYVRVGLEAHPVHPLDQTRVHKTGDEETLAWRHARSCYLVELVDLDHSSVP